MNSEHVELLRDLSEVCRAAIKAGDWKVDGACDPDSLLRHADAALASLSATKPPGDWVLVPRKPTPEMVCAGFLSKPDDSGILVDEPMDAPSLVWRAMLAHEGAMTSADYIEHCAGVLREHGYRVTASTLADIATEHRALAQQPAATLPDEDDSDLTVAYMAGRHDGRKEAQQPAAVDENWRKKAAEWLEAKAVEQEAANQRWPKHAACYKEWRDRPGILRHLAFQVLAAQQGGES